jgi:hypothetical protein
MLKHLGYRVYLDLVEYESDKHRRFELQEAFGVSFNHFRRSAAERFLYHLSDKIKGNGCVYSTRRFISAVLRKAAQVVSIEGIGSAIKVDDKKQLDIQTIPRSGNVILDGYWQSSYYFKPIESEIRKLLTFRVPDDHEVAKVIKDIEGCNSVSVHVRRGDYAENELFSRIYGGICTEHYYKRAFERIIDVVKKPRFFFFSDDPGWLDRSGLTYGLDTYRIVSIPGRASWIDMFLMSKCKCNIIANSSFSWWAAWLNANREKIVIAPSKWVNEGYSDRLCDLSGIHEENWILIDS